jgi:iron complex outermembrane receptor protein
MITKNIKYQHLFLASAIAGLFVLSTSESLAADIKIEITGSNIKRIEGEGALPVQIIGRDEILQSGATNAMEIMNLISANNSGGNVTLGSLIGAQTNGNQTASLRGLGGSSTLVLVNGKRLGTFAGAITGAEGVNLASIPFAAIERVEVLKDGASAVYGSDAIGGVINFIMRQDFSGVDATAWYGAPTRSGGGSQYQLMATAGYGDLSKDKYNVFLSFNYNQQNSLDQKDRNFSNSSVYPRSGPDIGTELNGTSGQTFPGYVYNPVTGDGLGNPGFPNCAPSIVLGSRCRYDPAIVDGVESIPETKAFNLFGSARYQINADWQAYLTGLYSHQEVRFIIQPTPLSDQIFTTATASGNSEIILQPNTPYYPHEFAAANGVDGQPLGVRYRCVVCGNRDNTDTTQAWQVIAGAKGTAWNWDFDGSFNYSENSIIEKPSSGFFRYTQIVPLLNTGIVNLFGPTSDASQQAVNALNFTQEALNAKLSGYGIDVKASGDIYQLPAGFLALALGLQAGKETLTQNYNEFLFTGDVTGYGGNNRNIDHSRTAWAVFGELNIPIIKNMEGNIAVRYDHYSDFGSTTNPKVSLRYQPVPQVLLRGSWGTGFLAPSLYQLFTPQTPGLTGTGQSDPLRCPDPNGPGSENNPDCNTQFVTTIGGNPNLKPEKSNQTTIGAIWEPVNGVSLGADWFYIDLKDLVSNGIAIGTILDPSLYSTYADQVTRAATCQGGLPCPITAINQTFVNLGRTKIQGIDVDTRFTSPSTEYGRWRAIVTGTYYISYEVQQPDGSFAGFVSNAFQAAATGITPRWKSYAALTWDYASWSSTLANSYQSSYIDVNTDAAGNNRRVGSLSLWDLQASYTGFKNTTLTLGVKNLFDTNPPFTNSVGLSFQLGYDPTYYDARARFIYGSIRYAFK